MSTASMTIFRSGRSRRRIQRIEYTSTPMLQPSTAILTVEPRTLPSINLRIDSSAGRFRRNIVPRYISRFARRHTSLCSHLP